MAVVKGTSTNRYPMRFLTTHESVHFGIVKWTKLIPISYYELSIFRLGYLDWATYHPGQFLPSIPQLALRT